MTRVGSQRTLARPVAKLTVAWATPGTSARVRSIRAAHEALAALPGWETPAIDEALRRALIEDLGLKPRNAFGAVRVAVTGRRISPPLFESLELLARERSLGRLHAALV